MTFGLVVGPVVRAGAAETGTTAAVASAAATAAATRASLRQDAAWIQQTARADGAIATNPDQRLVWPYLANFAAMGLARSAAAGDRRAAATAWRWLGWYQAHQDANGYVGDYVQTATGLLPNGNMDSTDAYAGTYLLAIESMYQATGNRARVLSLRRGIRGAMRAIESTQDVDGLTWAKPSWHVKYLMDQAETYAGLVAAANLGDALGMLKVAARATLDARRLHAGFARLWNPRVGAYDWAVHGDGARAATELVGALSRRDATGVGGRIRAGRRRALAPSRRHALPPATAMVVAAGHGHDRLGIPARRLLGRGDLGAAPERPQCRGSRPLDPVGRARDESGLAVHVGRRGAADGRGGPTARADAAGSSARRSRVRHVAVKARVVLGLLDPFGRGGSATGRRERVVDRPDARAPGAPARPPSPARLTRPARRRGAGATTRRLRRTSPRRRARRR